MNRKATIRNRASDLARLAARKWNISLIPSYFPGFKIEKSKPTAEVVEDLTDHIERMLEQGYPEETYTPKLDRQFNSVKDEDFLEALTTGQSIDPRTTEYLAFKPLYNPDQGPDWYGMNRATLEKHMEKLGYDAATGGRPEYARFLEALRNNAQRYERVKGVEEDMGSGLNIVNSMLMPSATEEAVKQAVTGEYDDDRMNRAVAVDALVGGGMTVGLSPELSLLSSGELKLASRLANRFLSPKKAGKFMDLAYNIPQYSVNIATTPKVAGAVAGGAETARQVANAIEGRDVNYYAPAGSALAAATVPAAAQLIGSTLAKETDPLARMKSRGFMGGLRGIDPRIQERNLLKAQVKMAREINRSMPEAGSQGATAPGSAVYRGNGAMAATESLGNVIEKLRFLGFPLESELPLRRPDIVGRPITVEDIIGSSSAAGGKRASGISGRAMKLVAPRAEGKNVVQYVLEKNGKGKGYDMVDAVLDAYDTPKMFLSFQESGGGKAVPRTTYIRNLDEYNAGKSLFPAKTEAEIDEAADPKTYELYRKLGKLVGSVFGKFEPMTRVNLLDVQGIGDRVENLKSKEWFTEAKTGKKKQDGGDSGFVSGKRIRSHKLIGGN